MATVEVHDDIAQDVLAFSDHYTEAREQPGPQFETLLLKAEFKGSDSFITAIKEKTTKKPARKRA